jgi:hypothetical protein
MATEEIPVSAYATKDFPMPDKDFSYKAVDASGKPLEGIPYKALDLNRPWQSFDTAHKLTTVGIQKFVADYRSTLRHSALGRSFTQEATT